MIAERSELRRNYPDSLSVLTLIPGGLSEKPTSSITTFEQEALANAGISSLQDVPKQDFVTAAKILAMDAIDFPEKLHVTPDGRKAILAYSLYVSGNATYRYTQAYMGVATEGLLNSVLDNIDLVKAYSHFEKFTNLVDSVMPSFRYEANKVKTVANEIAMIKRKGFDDEEIPEFFDLLRNILPRDAWGDRREGIVREVLRLKEEGLSDKEIIADKKRITERIPARSLGNENQTEKLKTDEKIFFSTHPEALKILKLKGTKLTNEKISLKLGIREWDERRAVSALFYFGKIKPRPLDAKKIELRNILLHQIKDFRVTDKLENTGIAEKLGISLERITQNASLLIWMGLVKPLEMSEVSNNYTGRRLRGEQLAGFLDSFPVNDRVNLVELHKQFCEKYGLDIGYYTFTSMYREIGKKHTVPPYKVTYPDSVRKRMVEEIQKIRAAEGNRIIIVADLCRDLKVNVANGELIFNTIRNTGPSNTNKWREEGKQQLLGILRDMAPTGETVNILHLCREIGISYSFGLQVYRDAEGSMDLPPLKPHKQRTMKTIIFEANLK